MLEFNCQSNKNQKEGMHKLSALFNRQDYDTK